MLVFLSLGILKQYQYSHFDTYQPVTHASSLLNSSHSKPEEGRGIEQRRSCEGLLSCTGGVYL